MRQMPLIFGKIKIKGNSDTKLNGHMNFIPLKGSQNLTIIIKRKSETDENFIFDCLVLGKP